MGGLLFDDLYLSSKLGSAVLLNDGNDDVVGAFFVGNGDSANPRALRKISHQC